MPSPLPIDRNPPVREGDVIAGKYVIERVIAFGGMGVLVAARHQMLDGLVAFKFVQPSFLRGERVAERFLREARAASRIKSEHVAKVMDFGVLENGSPYMMMEYLEGSDLSRILERRGPLSPSESADYLMQALEAVAEAHKSGIVHRDLKPSNLFLTERADGSPLIKVLDFGIAKAMTELNPVGGTDLTSTQGILGSPQYMSPEQIRSAKYVDARSDVWAIGVMLHELLTKTSPFTGDTAAAILASIAADEPIPARRARPDLPVELEHLILDCLVKNRDQRIPDVRVLAERLAPFGSEIARWSLAKVRSLVEHGVSTGPGTAVAASSVDAHIAAVRTFVRPRTLESFDVDVQLGSRRRKSHARAAITVAALATVAIVVMLALRSQNSSATGEAAPASPTPAPAVLGANVNAGGDPRPLLPVSTRSVVASSSTASGSSTANRALPAPSQRMQSSARKGGQTAIATKGSSTARTDGAAAKKPDIEVWFENRK